MNRWLSSYKYVVVVRLYTRPNLETQQDITAFGWRENLRDTPMIDAKHHGFLEKKTKKQSVNNYPNFNRQKKIKY